MAHRFEPSDASFYGAPAAKKAGGLLDMVQDAFTSSNAAISGWGALISAIEDPRERVAALTAKIKNYERMRKKYGIGPIGDLYTNEIQLMRARLKAEKKGLVIQKEGEGALWIWRIAGWGIAGGLVLLLASKAYAAVTQGSESARVTNPRELDRYTVTNADDLATVGLPAYMLGTWEHYATNGGYVRLGRVSGKGSKFASFLVKDFDKAVSVGLFVPRRANPGPGVNAWRVDDRQLARWAEEDADDGTRPIDPEAAADRRAEIEERTETRRQWERAAARSRRRFQNPRVTMDDVDPRERFQLASVADGWAEVRDGHDRQAYKKWALCASRDGKKPLKRYTNGGPVGLLRPTSGKTERGPLWHHRAQGFVRLVGGLPLPGLYDVASWYSRHRAGTYPLPVD